MILDKTGTLTLGRPQLCGGDYGPHDLALAAALAAASRHPLAVALAASVPGARPADDVQEFPGKGLQAVIDGRQAQLGSRAWCGEAAAPLDPARLELWLRAGDNSPRHFLLADPLRPDAADAVDGLKRRGFDVHLLSGDRAAAVAHAAAALGITNARGDLTPADKFSYLEDLKAKGRHVLMVGDGLNDAPVLAGAHASISPATGIDLAQNAADIVFTGDRLMPVCDAVDTARLSQRLVHQNFILAVFYNVIAIPLAVAGLVTPLIAAIAMSGSSLLVIANSFRLRLRSRPPRKAA